MITFYFSFDPDPKVRNTFWTLTIGGALTAMPVWTVSQTAVQRFLAIRSFKDAKRYVTKQRLFRANRQDVLMHQ